MFIESITKEALADLPLHAFDGEIVLIENEEQLKSVINYLKNQDVLGFDTETKPSFKRGQVHQVALLQLSTCDKLSSSELVKLGCPMC
jgi:3'-5' exonuclease